MTDCGHERNASDSAGPTRVRGSRRAFTLIELLMNRDAECGRERTNVNQCKGVV